MDDKYNLDIEYGHSLTEDRDDVINKDALSDNDILSDSVNDNVTLYTEKDVLLACCGDDEDNNANAITAIRMSIMDLVTGDEVRVEDEITMTEPVINISRGPRFTMVDLTFMPNSFNLVNAVARMQAFIKAENRQDDAENLVPSIFLTISPKNFDAVTYCTGAHGAWYVMTSKIGHPMDTIRFIYDNELFGTFVAPMTGSSESEV